jgi:hypothetical protein
MARRKTIHMMSGLVRTIKMQAPSNAMKPRNPIEKIPHARTLDLKKWLAAPNISNAEVLPT